jgi:DNA helicase II / ATP-dependent DNA helicase PcrA
MLDDSQRTFCAHPKKAIRLLAPAGSGKTHSLLWRCMSMLANAGDSKPRFLLFTFTKAARDELRDRIRSDPDYRELAGFVDITTLNSWGYRRLQQRLTNLRLITDSKTIYFTVHNQLKPIWDQERYAQIRSVLTSTKAKGRAATDLFTVSDTLKSLGFRHDRHNTSEAFRDYLRKLSETRLGLHFQNSVLQKLVDMEVLEEAPLKRVQAFIEHYLPYWVESTEQLFRASTITLEDQKYFALLDVEQAVNDNRFTSGIHRVEHVLVDEFQDINRLDLNLLSAIAAVNKAELTIVGDDDQAIYEWRGATPEFILEPDRHIGGRYDTCILEKNYRSPRNVVAVSQKLIKNNKNRVDKNVRAVSTTDAEIRVRSMPSLNDTINYVTAEVEKLLADGRYHKIAIIGRKRSQIIPYQIVFASKNLPFYAAEDLQVFLGKAFADLKEILAIKARAGVGAIPGLDPVMDLMKLVDNVRKYPLKKTDAGELTQYLRSERPAALMYRGPLKGDNSDGARSASFVQAIIPLISASSVSSTIQAISANFDGLQKDYGRALNDIFFADPPFLYLAEYASRYGNDYGRFLQDVELAVATLARTNPDEEKDEKTPRAADWKRPLHLMTALRAKGKEYDAVFILDVNKDIWPIKLAETEQQLEQERRVFYVAFTRVRKQITLLVNQKMLGELAYPSPYLTEMGLKAS